MTSRKNVGEQYAVLLGASCDTPTSVEDAEHGHCVLVRGSTLPPERRRSSQQATCVRVHGVLWDEVDTDWLSPVTQNASARDVLYEHWPREEPTPPSIAHSIRIEWRQRANVCRDANHAEAGPMRISVQGTRMRGATALDLARDLLHGTL